MLDPLPKDAELMTMLAHYRDNKRDKLLCDIMLEHPVEGQDSEKYKAAAARIQAEIQAIDNLVAALPENEATVIRGLYLNKPLKGAEIATNLNCSRSLVFKIRDKAIQHMSDMLNII
jgi:DNA-directed RNA polymerase specialized sigma subunit